MKQNLLWKAAEAAVNLKLIELGYDTFIPFNTGGEVDLVALKDGKVFRIQIKSSLPKNNVVSFNLELASVNYRSAVKSAYTNIDIFLFYDGTNIFKIDTLQLKDRTNISFRYSKPKNNQSNYNFYLDYILQVL